MAGFVRFYNPFLDTITPRLYPLRKGLTSIVMAEGCLMTGNNDTMLVSGVIRSVCQEHDVRIEEMLLFGSRTRRDNRETSDYDFIVVTPQPLGHDLKMQLWLHISRALADLKVTADILFKSREEYRYDRLNKGKVTYYAVREGIPV